MAEKVGPGQRDKAASEEATARVGAENKADEQARQREKVAAEQRQQDEPAESPQQAKERRNQARRELDKTDSAAEKFRKAQDENDSDLLGEVAITPYPEYGDKGLGALKALAESRKVEIGRDVEKAELVKVLREKDRQNEAGLDFMTLEELRALAAEKDVKLPDEFVTAHLITALRAADSGVNTGGGRVA